MCPRAFRQLRQRSSDTDLGPVTDAASYNLYYLNGAAPVIGSTGNKLTGVTSPYTIGLTPGLTYYFALTSVNAAGTESAGSTPATAVPLLIPAAPAAPSASYSSDGTVVITGSAVTYATGYRLYWSTSSTVSTTGPNKITNSGTSAYAFNVSGLALGTSYYFIITALNGSLESAPSPQAIAKTFPVAPRSTRTRYRSTTALPI